MYSNLKVLAIVPARAGSKGVKAKNIRDLHGMPLIGWVIKAGLSSKYIDRVIVSTDGVEIAERARGLGAEVPFMRPLEHAQDQTPDAPVFEHALSWLKENEDYEPDIVVHLRATGPLVTSEELDEAIELMAKHPDADSVRSMQKPGKPPYKMWKPASETSDSGFMIPFMTGIPLPDDFLNKFKDWHTAPRQALPAVFETTADIGIMWARVITQQHSVIGDKVVAYILKRPTVDIDTIEDFDIAAFFLEKREKSA